MSDVERNVVTELLEERALFAKVVELAVIDDADLIVWRGHRLVSGVADVDDREPRHAERHVLIFKHAAVVGATMMQSADHSAARQRARHPRLRRFHT